MSPQGQELLRRIDRLDELLYSGSTGDQDRDRLIEEAKALQQYAREQLHRGELDEANFWISFIEADFGLNPQIGPVAESLTSS